ncbi:uncharacterized protein LTR77_009939 [Saxophila tyrrhenica]|uniref:Chitin-binding type-1 domain-containing protein n=1 Tax=Saxophila tyrrhenica TaxID=1690608 RepID=A0AAV9NX06_9PEZI|nr:hypothetical protein LTR77_009939 [Saxophila tyrrhenica]
MALLILALVTVASVNIIFPFIQPSCDFYHNPDTCLRGQVCTENNQCVPDLVLASHATRATAARADGRCGRDFSDATCDPAGPYGGCCSGHGYCGVTPEHCLVANGCQSDCGSPSDISPGTPSAPPTATSPDATLSEPVIGPGATTSAAAQSGPAATDGTCGAGNGGTVCCDWIYGSCCSMYGFCGSTNAHCGKGCQSGPCNQAPIASTPGPSPAPVNPLLGSFRVVGDSGVPAMHAALMPNGNVVFLEKVENYTNLDLPNGQLAYSSEYDPLTNKRVPLA